MESGNCQYLGVWFDTQSICKVGSTTGLLLTIKCDHACKEFCTEPDTWLWAKFLEAIIQLIIFQSNDKVFSAYCPAFSWAEEQVVEISHLLYQRQQ